MVLKFGWVFVNNFANVHNFVRGNSRITIKPFLVSLRLQRYASITRYGNLLDPP